MEVSDAGEWAFGARPLMTLTQEPNSRSNLDFVSDTLADGRRFLGLIVIDDFMGMPGVRCLALGSAGRS
jgi:hypothetical protein